MQDWKEIRLDLKEGQLWKSSITNEERTILFIMPWQKDLGGDEITFTSSKIQRAQTFKWGRLSYKYKPIQIGEKHTVGRRAFVSWIKRNKGQEILL